MDLSDDLFSFRFFPIHSSEEFDDPSGHNLFLVMGWFWNSVLPFGRYKCYHWRSKGVEKVLKIAFFNSVKKRF